MTGKAIETAYNPDGSIEFSLSGSAYRCRFRPRATELEVIDGAELGERIDLAPGRTFAYISEEDTAAAARAYLQRLGKYDLPATNRIGGRKLRAELGQARNGEPLVRFFTIKIGGGRGGKLGELSLSQLEVVDWLTGQQASSEPAPSRDPRRRPSPLSGRRFVFA